MRISLTKQVFCAPLCKLSKMSFGRKRPGKMALCRTNINDSCGHTWPSRFLSVALILLFAKAITTTAQNYGGKTVNPPPLQISTHDLKLKVGTTSTIQITPTENFQPTFQNLSVDSLVLVLQSSHPGIIQDLPNITLIGPLPGPDNKTGPIANTSTVNIVALHAGQLTVTSQVVPNITSYTPSNLFVRVAVYKLDTLVLLSNIVGWIYFLAWSVSFYPQIIQNYQRKSVRGLSLDFTFLNITGFSVYLVYNVGLFWIKSVQQEYYEEYPQGIIPVQLNDVIFTAHALFACTVIAIQCLIYDRGSQTISDSGKMLLCTFFVFIFIIFIVAASNAITWLTFLTWCSYVKLVITLIKYIPQAYLNWYRKSTSGWCIGNVNLDFTGGAFSLAQMVMIAYNHNDWSSFFGDVTKFGLGLFSILFDIFFMVQHYILYKNHAAYEPIESGACPPDSHQYGDITTSNQYYASSTDGDNPEDHLENASIPRYTTINPSASTKITGNQIRVVSPIDDTDSDANI